MFLSKSFATTNIDFVTNINIILKSIVKFDFKSIGQNGIVETDDDCINLQLDPEECTDRVINSTGSKDRIDLEVKVDLGERQLE